MFPSSLSTEREKGATLGDIQSSQTNGSLLPSHQRLFYPFPHIVSGISTRSFLPIALSIAALRTREDTIRGQLSGLLCGATSV